MANFEVPDNPNFSNVIRKFEITDPAHADLFNDVIKVLLENDCFLRKSLDEISVTGTLSTGETTITLSDDHITEDSTLDFYTSIYGVSPKTVTVATGRVTLTFKEQTEDMQVKVVIHNGNV